MSPGRSTQAAASSVADARVAAFRARLTKNLKRLSSWRRASGGWAECFRAFDRDMPELPIAVDVFAGESGLIALNVIGWAPRHGGGASFAALVEACAAEAAAVIGAELKATGVHHVAQIREPGVGGELAAGDVDGSSLELVVREGPARFIVRLGARRDPGLFLDHRLTRRLVADAARGRRVLNLFAYTGSFSVQTALAGALRTVSVDLSASTCRWAEENLALNDLRGPAHTVVSGDALDLDALDVDDADVIIVDPPSFSKSRRARPDGRGHADFDVQRDHPQLISAALRRLRPGGELWFSCNRRGFELATDALPRDVVVVDDLTAASTPPDFRGAPHTCVRLRRS